MKFCLSLHTKMLFWRSLGISLAYSSKKKQKEHIKIIDMGRITTVQVIELEFQKYPLEHKEQENKNIKKSTTQVQKAN